ncbi:MAG: hydrogenase expression/formation protein HypE [Akkermansiaceae bacterium]|nr:hydrogenase expression/formation protein HypE [Akkermansiaceae bacterium]
MQQRHDGAVLPVGGLRLAFTTDSYVVQPRWFPGGDIGSLSVNGTVNDLAMCGARPLHLSAGFIIEEGLPSEELARVVQSMRAAADAAEVTLVTGDTKVVDRGSGDGLFINTSGIGLVEHEFEIGPAAVEGGDAILLSGDLGRHGIAILSKREGLQFESTIRSDCAPLHEVVLALLEGGIEIHCLRDLTRGGLASAVVEIANHSGFELHLLEDTLPVSPEVRGACEILGLDPLYVANEGTMLAIVPGCQADQALAIMRRIPVSAAGVRAGEVDSAPNSRVLLESPLGTRRVVAMLPGEQLPRIC